MMSYIIGALVIVATQSRQLLQFDSIPTCDPACSSSQVCDLFANPLTGEAACVSKCTSNTQCTDRDSGAFTPFCDTDLGSCQPCTDDAGCADSLIFDGAPYCWESAGTFVPINICSDTPSMFCDEKADCTDRFSSEDMICMTVTSQDDSSNSFGICQDTSEIPFCSVPSDCDGGSLFGEGDETNLFYGLGVDCVTDLDGLFGEEDGIDFGTGETFTVDAGFCLPISQCSDDDDCDLEGLECMQFSDADDTEGLGIDLGICFYSNSTRCASSDDCSGNLQCYEEEETCYLPCEKNGDCITDNIKNFACGTPDDAEDIQGCIPIGLGNVTFVSEPTTDVPVIEDPSEDGEDMASVLAIFGGMVIMISGYIFM